MTCLGKSCSFGVLCVSFVNVYEFVYVLQFPFGFEGVMWDLILKIAFLITLSYTDIEDCSDHSVCQWSAKIN